MDRFWKQFVGWVTASEHNVFLRARLKLTALYVLIVAVIVFGFSIFLYQSIDHNLRDASEDDFAGTENHRHFINNTLPAVQNEFIFADIVILAVAAALSYVLAGKTLEPIQRSVEAQQAFAANASHELRTPLAVMKNDIEVFLRNEYPSLDQTKATMYSNLEEITRMSGIVGNLLQLARSDANVTQELEEVDLAKIVIRVTDKMRPLAESRGVRVTSDVVPTHVLGNESSLERVFLNILQNSIDHTAMGGSVSVSIMAKGKQAIIHLVDTGSGIPDKDLPHVFTRFYKGESATGTGLGLSIVREIIRQHNGNIAIESAVGKGTTVVIRLPRIA